MTGILATDKMAAMLNLQNTNHSEVSATFCFWQQKVLEAHKPVVYIRSASKEYIFVERRLDLQKKNLFRTTCPKYG